MAKIKETIFTKGVKSWLKRDFPMYGDRFRVIDEYVIYNAKDHPLVWEEKKDSEKKGFYRAEVFLELARGSTEYVCDIRSDWPESRARIAVLTGLQNIKRELESYVSNKLVI